VEISVVALCRPPISVRVKGWVGLGVRVRVRPVEDSAAVIMRKMPIPPVQPKRDPIRIRVRFS